MEGKTKENIASQQNKYREFTVELDKIIKMLDKNADVSNYNYVLLRLIHINNSVHMNSMCNIITGYVCTYVYIYIATYAYIHTYV